MASVYTIEINDKRYTQVRILAYLARSAIALNRETLDFAKQAQEIQKSDVGVEDVEQITERISELNDRKSNLVCEVFENKFTVDELERNYSVAEITELVQKIVSGIGGTLTKNLKGAQEEVPE
jgi:hypothetical protein